MIYSDRTDYPVSIPTQDEVPDPTTEVQLMARRTSKAQTENPTTEEAPVSTETTEAPTEAATETTTEAPIDLTSFNEAVATAITEADAATGEVPTEQIEAVKTAYRALDGAKPKNAAKKAVNESMKDAMNSGDLPKARAYLMISENSLVAGGGGGGEKAPADPTEAFVQRVATLSLGYNLAVNNVPEGVGSDWQDRVNQLVTESLTPAQELLAFHQSDAEGDGPEATAVVRNAVKLAEGKSAKAGSSRSGGTFTGERKNIGTHIESAFSDVEEGTFLTIAEIRNKRSDEYGDNPPSAGAVSARLFPSSGKSSMLKVGIRPDTQNGKKGAVKDSSAAAE